MVEFHIDFNNTCSLSLTNDEKAILYHLTKTSGFKRIYKNLNSFEEDIENKDKRAGVPEKKYHTALPEAKDRFDIKDTILKNQLALGLIAEKINDADKHDNKDITIILNPVLMYELYLTVQGNLKRFNTIIKNPIDRAKNPNTINDYNRAIKALESIKESIILTTSIETMFILEEDYNKMTVAEHLEYCLK